MKVRDAYGQEHELVSLQTATPKQSEEFARRIAEAWVEKRQIHPLEDPACWFYLQTVIHTLGGIEEMVAAPGTFPYPPDPLQMQPQVKPIEVPE